MRREWSVARNENLTKSLAFTAEKAKTFASRFGPEKTEKSAPCQELITHPHRIGQLMRAFAVVQARGVARYDNFRVHYITARRCDVVGRMLDFALTEPLPQGTFTVSLSGRYSVYFFTVEVKQPVQRVLRVRFPKQIERIRRRQQQRVIPDRDVEVRLVHPRHPMVRICCPVYDLSYEGVSFEIEDRSRYILEKGEIDYLAVYQDEQRLWEGAATVRHLVTVIHPETGLSHSAICGVRLQHKESQCHAWFDYVSTALSPNTAEGKIDTNLAWHLFETSGSCNRRY